jgi:hypothetical protein
VPVDEQDVSVGLVQSMGGTEPGKAAAEDDNARALAHAGGTLC